MDIRRQITEGAKSAIEAVRSVNIEGVKCFTVKHIKTKKVKVTAILVVGTLVVVTTAGISNSNADLSKKKKVSDSFVAAGVSADIMLAKGTLNIDSAELVAVSLTDTSTTDMQSGTEATTGAVEAQPVHSVTGYNNLGVANVGNYLNIRETPSESGKLCGKLPQNAGCEILEETNGWYRIQSGKVSGYVKSEYLLTSEAAWAKAEEVKSMTATVTTQTLYVREQPNTECKILTLVPMDEELEVLEEQEQWVKVIVDSDEGYVNKSYVSIGYQLPKAVALTELQTSSGVSDKCVSIVEYAKQFLGNPYVWGGTSLTKGTDCSGFTMAIYAKYGISLPHSSSSQAGMGTKVSPSQAKPGDLFFYGSGNRVNHVAMYIGGGKVIHASTAKTGIKISNAFYRTPITVRRFFN